MIRKARSSATAWVRVYSANQSATVGYIKTARTKPVISATKLMISRARPLVTAKAIETRMMTTKKKSRNVQWFNCTAPRLRGLAAYWMEQHILRFRKNPLQPKTAFRIQHSAFRDRQWAQRSLWIVAMATPHPGFDSRA